MHLVYFSHSYRKEDAAIVRYFGELIRNEGLIPVLDPPSESVNAARLQRHLRDSDGMVVVLTRRDNGVSPHILFEATLCLQARKPLLIFVEDMLSGERLPRRLLKSRFSRKWFFRQIRDHRQAVSLFKSYLGQDPPPRYQPSSERQTCLALGLSVLQRAVQGNIVAAIENLGYNVVSDCVSDRVQDQSIRLSEHLASADIAVELIDSRRTSDQYLMGAVRAAFIPCISLTSNQKYRFDPSIPVEYQPKIFQNDEKAVTQAMLEAQFQLYEQAFIELESPEEVTRYVELLLKAANPIGEYTRNTRNLFIQEINMGDQYKVGQAGAVGPQSHAHDMSFQQMWNEAGPNFDLNILAEELSRLRPALKEAATTAEEDVAVGEVALAEVAAKQSNGPKALSHLKNAGRWTLGIAEKIGVGLATAAIKTAIDI